MAVSQSHFSESEKHSHTRRCRSGLRAESTSYNAGGSNRRPNSSTGSWPTDHPTSMETQLRPGACSAMSAPEPRPPSTLLAEQKRLSLIPRIPAGISALLGLPPCEEARQWPGSLGCAITTIADPGYLGLPARPLDLQPPEARVDSIGPGLVASLRP